MAREDFTFFHPLRVRWSEVDMQAIVFNGHYLNYMKNECESSPRVLFHEAFVEGLRIAFKRARFIILLAGAVLMFALSACSTAPKAVYHGFSYGGFRESQDVEILNFQYGSSKLPGTHADEYGLSQGHIGQRWSMYGAFPPGDFLYVKWRVESTGKVYEDTVDLKDRLPSNIANNRIHFSISESQLYVYLISEQLHSRGCPDCPAPAYHLFKCATLYPEHQQNF